MFKIYTEKEWLHKISTWDFRKKLWYNFDNTWFSVEIPFEKITGNENNIRRWIETEFTHHDVYCIIKSIMRSELTTKEKEDIRIAVTKRLRKSTKIVTTFFISKRVPYTQEEIEEQIKKDEEAYLRHLQIINYFFYFLNEEDAVAFKIRWQ